MVGKALVRAFNVRAGHLKQVPSNTHHLDTWASNYNMDEVKATHQELTKRGMLVLRQQSTGLLTLVLFPSILIGSLQYKLAHGNEMDSRLIS